MTSQRLDHNVWEEKMPDPYDLSGHEYRATIEAYSRSTRWKSVPAEWENCAHAHLCVDDIVGAVECLQNAERLRERLNELPGLSAKSVLMGVALFLSRNGTAAIAHLTSMLTDIDGGKVTYTDPAGGIGVALPLWYCADRTGSASGISVAQTFIRKRLRRKNFRREMPGPIAQHLFNELSSQELLHVVAGTGDPHEVAQVGREGSIAIREFLMIALFYISFKFKLSGDEASAFMYMRRCAMMENLHGYPEWYLAREACGMGLNWASTTSPSN